MMTHYHVAGEGYTSGDPILCRNLLQELGIETPWKWEDADEGFDGDVVCLFASRDDAEEFQREFGGTILTIDINESDLDEPSDGGWAGFFTPRLTTVAEGYTAVLGGIPTSWIIA